MTMGEIIKKLREENHMTQEDLGEKLGVQKSAIRKYEKGEVENIKRSSIQKMSEIFNVDPCYLMGWEEQYNANQKLTQEVSLIEQIQYQYGKDAAKLLECFIQLNVVGQEKALENISDLVALEKYTQKKKQNYETHRKHHLC